MCQEPSIELLLMIEDNCCPLLWHRILHHLPPWTFSLAFYNHLFKSSSTNPEWQKERDTHYIKLPQSAIWWYFQSSCKIISLNNLLLIMQTQWPCITRRQHKQRMTVAVVTLRQGCYIIYFTWCAESPVQCFLLAQQTAADPPLQHTYTHIFRLYLFFIK